MFGHLEWQFNPHDLLKAQSLIIYTSINNWKLLFENKRAINMLATLSVIIQIVEGAYLAYLVWGSDLGIPVVDVLTTNSWLSEMTILWNVIRIVILKDRPFWGGVCLKIPASNNGWIHHSCNGKSYPTFVCEKKVRCQNITQPPPPQKKTNGASLETNPYHS